MEDFKKIIPLGSVFLNLYIPPHKNLYFLTPQLGLKVENKKWLRQMFKRKLIGMP